MTTAIIPAAELAARLIADRGLRPRSEFEDRDSHAATYWQRRQRVEMLDEVRQLGRSCLDGWDLEVTL